MQNRVIGHLIVAALLVISGSGAHATDNKDLSLKDLAPTKEQGNAAADRAQQAKDKADHQERMDRARQKSEAEMKIDKIPKETKVEPTMAPDGKGAGAKVTIPTR